MQDLVVGEKYTLTFREKTDGFTQTVKKRMKLIGIYTYHAVFLNKAGYAVSVTYFDLKRLLEGKEI